MISLPAGIGEKGQSEGPAESGAEAFMGDFLSGDRFIPGSVFRDSLVDESEDERLSLDIDILSEKAFFLPLKGPPEAVSSNFSIVSLPSP